MRVRYLSPALLTLLMSVSHAADYSLFKLELIMAQKGDPDAQFNVGHAYEQGQDVTQDVKQAFYWYQKAAKQNHDFAQYSIGLMYERGVGTSKDMTQAMNWYQVAAENGNELARQRLSGAKAAEQAAVAATKQPAPSKPKPKPVVIKQPEREPVVVKQPEPPAEPETVEQRKKLDPAEVLSVVMRGKWKYNGTPADFLPSAYSHCLAREDSEIICFTSERKKLVDNELVSFTTKSTINDFNSSGKFTVNYLYNVTDISSSDQAGPKDDPHGLQRKEGWQPANLMECETSGTDKLSCKRGNKRYVFTQ